MRISTILTSLAAMGPAPSGNLKVPGESPVEYCNSKRNGDLLVISKVDINPNPPVAGKTFNISASGDLKGPITSGSYVKFTLKYHRIPLIKATTDICEDLSNMDVSCPLEEGKFNFNKTFALNSQIPRGPYTLLADAYTVKNDHIACLTAKIKFSKSSLVEEL